MKIQFVFKGNKHDSRRTESRETNANKKISIYILFFRTQGGLNFIVEFFFLHCDIQYIKLVCGSSVQLYLFRLIETCSRRAQLQFIAGMKGKKNEEDSAVALRMNLYFVNIQHVTIAHDGI